uniref:Uncharacterized protein n=1 Tax=Bosea sp. NBC_00436 TaxID=2969620 RepID=A0A9E8A345_9HYPH
MSLIVVTGHIGTPIESGGKNPPMVGDEFFHPSLHPVTTNIGFIFEQGPQPARAMRAASSCARQRRRSQ